MNSRSAPLLQMLAYLINKNIEDTKLTKIKVLNKNAQF